jgi:hypothetical protein
MRPVEIVQNKGSRETWRMLPKDSIMSYLVGN